MLRHGAGVYGTWTPASFQALPAPSQASTWRRLLFLSGEEPLFLDESQQPAQLFADFRRHQERHAVVGPASQYIAHDLDRHSRLACD